MKPLSFTLRIAILALLLGIFFIVGAQLAGIEKVVSGNSSVAASQLTVVGLGGSLAKHSSSLAALKIALQGAEEAGAKTALLDIRQLSLPMYDPADENPPASVLEMCNAIYDADGLVWSSPMYNGTISGAFKNALD